jgi:hypothetical protein|tara:strand:+ start:9855 stop:11882 length:2028 start_codon:yes stop_codon:yes gene_type:complete
MKSLLIVFFAALLFIGAVYAVSYTVSVDNKPISAAWSQTAILYSNITPQYNMQGDSCTQRTNVTGDGLSGTSYNVTMFAEFFEGGSDGVFVENITTLAYIANGTINQYNITSVGESPAEGWEYYWKFTNNSVITDYYANCSNISFTSDTYTFKVDTINPVVTVNWPPSYTTAGNFTTNSITFNATAVETNPNNGALYTNESGTFIENNSFSYTNDTEAGNFVVDGFPDGYISYYWNFTDDSGRLGNSATTIFFVDATAPTLETVLANNSWSKTKSTAITYKPTDEFISECYLWLDTTQGGQTLVLNQTDSAIESGATNTFTVALEDTVYETPYYYTIGCVDSLGNAATNLSGYAVNVDSTFPTIPSLTIPLARYQSDRQPNITHLPSIENNFLTYALEMYNSSGSFFGQVNDSTTNMSYGTIFASNLAWEMNYTYNMTVYDRAGNRNSTVFDVNNNTAWYAADETCAVLYEGYNYCGVIRDSTPALNITLGSIATETDAEIVYIFNNSHSWVTYVAGSSTNQYYNVSRGEVIVAYINSTTSPSNWEERYWTWNTSMNNEVLGDYNLSRRNNDGYQLVSLAMNFSRINFTELQISFENGDSPDGTWNADNNTQMLSYINNSALGDGNNNNTFVPFRMYWDINDGISLDYGEAWWVNNKNETIPGETVWNRTKGGAG